MIIKIKNSDLLTMLKQITGAISKEKGSLFEYVFIKSINENIFCMSINQEMQIITYGTLIENQSKCEILIKYELIYHICRTHNDTSIIFLKKNNNSIDIIIENTKFSIPILDSGLFPLLYDNTKSFIKFKVKALVLNELFKKALIPTTDDTQKNFLSGVVLNINKNKLNILSYDSFRLIYSYILVNNENEDYTIILSPKVVKEVINMSNSDDYINFAISYNYVTFISFNTTLISRVSRNIYNHPKITLSIKNCTIISVDTKTIRKSFKKLSVLCVKNSKIIMRIDKKNITFSVQHDQHNAFITLNNKNDNTEIIITLHYNHLMDILKLITSDLFDIEISPDQTVIIIRENKKSYIYILTVLHV